VGIDYGRAANPGAYVMGILIPLGTPVEPERPEDAPVPFYVVNAIPGTPDRFSRNAIVSVHSFGSTHALAWAAADAADHQILSTSNGDVITLPDGSTATGDVGPNQLPHYINYRDPRVKRYLARYAVSMRFI
jgi:hypothetical protein